jgi:hypothetical protein
MKKRIHFLAAIVLITAVLFSDKAQAQAPQNTCYKKIVSTRNK